MVICLSLDPIQWSTDQVLHWVVWVMKEFSMTDIDLTTLNISGRELCSLSQEDFFQRVPRGEILWSHLELLRKCIKLKPLSYLRYNLSLIVFLYNFVFILIVHC